jgi:hypothetical protein
MPVTRLAFLLALASGMSLLADDEAKKPTPKFKLGKDTTYVTEPLDDEGYLDYESALNRKLRGKSTPESNAVVTLLRVFGPKPEGAELKPDFYKWLGVEAPPEDGPYLVPHGKHFLRELQAADRQAFDDLETRLRRKPWKSEDAPRHADWLKLNEKPLALAVEASRKKDYFHPWVARDPKGGRAMLIGALLPMVQRNREIASALSLRAALKLGQGRIVDAFEDVLAIHRLARLTSQGASNIELLVGIALQSIAHQSEITIFEHGKPTAKQALAYQAELLKLPPMATVADKLRLGERFVFLDAVQSMPREGGENVAGAADLAGKTPEEILRAIDFELIFRMGNDFFDRYEAALGKPTRAERQEAATAISKEMKGLMDRAKNPKLRVGANPEALRKLVSEGIGAVYLDLMMPAFVKLADVTDRSGQTHRNGVVLTALGAHFADEKKYPDKLTDLVPKYLKELPGDVFSGKELIYSKTEAGYLIYSIGPNGKDDGGRLLTDEPRGDDVGVRMPRK